VPDDTGRAGLAAGARVVTAAEEQLRHHPTFREIHGVWPEFLLHDRVINEHWNDLYTRCPEFQFCLYDAAAERVLAEGNTVPVVWDGAAEPGGVDWAIPQVRSDAAPTTLCALQAVVRRDAQGHGLSRLMVETMRTLARERGLDCLIAPVRPPLKASYPLTPIDRFVEWRRDDGLLLDPWLRTHERLGAELLGVAPESMRIEGAVPEWERWTGLAFPDDGDYVVAGALVPVRFANGRGVYVEPNVWMRHSVEA
jgi:GNAT superfamily N-acetyltransferase